MIHHAGHLTGTPAKHPDGTCLAATRLTVEYFGKPAHSAGDPYNGVNALNALIKFFTGLDALRQHIRMEERIHGIITHGGEAVNVVPKYTRGALGVRAASRANLEALLKKTQDIAQGAALMTGCEVKVTLTDTPYYDMRPSYVIGDVYRENMLDAGLEVGAGREGRGMYSTDFGNVSYHIPAVTGSFAIAHEPIPGHSQQVLDASGSEYGYDQFIKASTAMALTALDILTDPQLKDRAWEEHRGWEG
jgi:metal-dependent amidase/aminoacylase/carboxypeptidase family protein